MLAIELPPTFSLTLFELVIFTIKFTGGLLLSFPISLCNNITCVRSTT